MSHRPPRLLWLGTYESDYTRTRVLMAGLRDLGVEVVQCHRPLWELTPHKAGSFLSPARLPALGAQAARAWIELLIEQRGVGPVDAVVAGYPPQPDSLPTWVVARGKRVPLVSDVMISFADTLAGDRARVGGAGGAAFAAIDTLALRLPDVVICDTYQHLEYFHERFGVPRERMGVARLGAESAVFPPAPAPEGEPYAFFYGKLAPSHGIDTILEAARVPGTPPVRLAGEGQLGDWLDGELARNHPPGFQYVPWVPHDQLGGALADAAIVLGIFGTSEKVRRVVPNKVYHAMSVGRPIITADTPGIREILEDEQNVILVPPGDPQALAAAMTRLAGDADLRRRLGEAARARFLEIAEQSVVARDFMRTISRATGIAPEFR